MVSDPKDRTFQEGVIHLTPDAVDRLARTMEELTDADLAAESDGLSPAPADSRFNRELVEIFAAQMSERRLQRDPSCASDQELWSRIQKAGSQASAPVRPLKPKGRSWVLGSGALAAAAAILVMVRPWGSEPNPIDPLSHSNVKGVVINEGAFASHGCYLAVRTGNVTSEPEIRNAGIPASTPILLLSRCKQAGFLHLQLTGGQDQLFIPNIPVEAGTAWQELMDQSQTPLGVMTPGQGLLQITYGWSAQRLESDPSAESHTQPLLTKPEAWLWMRQVQWPVHAQEARP